MNNKSTTPVQYTGKHTFTQDEKNKKTEQMLQAMRLKEEIEADFKTTKSNYKLKLDQKDAEIKLLANLLNAGFEDKTFDCFLFKDFDNGKKVYTEVGTNVVVGEEPLTSEDYQMQMDLEQKEIQANNEATDIEIAKQNTEPEYTIEENSNPLEINEEAVPEETSVAEVTPAIEETPIVNINQPKKEEAKPESKPTQQEPEIDDYPFSLSDNSSDDDDEFNFGDI